MTASWPETIGNFIRRNLDYLFEDARRHRLAMLAKASQVTFDRLTYVFGGLHACSYVGNASWQSRASRHKHAILVWFQINRYFTTRNSIRAESRLAAPFPPTPKSSDPLLFSPISALPRHYRLPPSSLPPQLEAFQQLIACALGALRNRCTKPDFGCDPVNALLS